MLTARKDFEFTEAPTDDVGASFIFPATDKNLRAAAKILQQGGLIAVPTETVYGLAANALDESACRKIFELKGRPLLDPLIVHLRAIDEGQKIASWNPPAKVLASAFMPGPLTLILPKKNSIPDIVTAGKQSVALRLPSHPVFQALAGLSGRPLAAPSANPFGYISPSKAEHVLNSFPQAGLPILNGGACSIGIESTIVDLRDAERPRLLRSGNVHKSDLERSLGMPVEDMTKTMHDAQVNSISSPGSLARHYSPDTLTILVEPNQLQNTPPSAGRARVFYKRPLETQLDPKGDFWLSERGDCAQAQQNLYDLLRTLDLTQEFKEIHIECPSPGEETAALIDRLTRAASK